MGGVINQQILSGIINGSTIEDIIFAIERQGYALHSLDRIITDGMNNYHRAITRLQMDEAPDNTLYVYIGPADEKTRDFCLSAMSYGELTLDQIKQQGGEWNDSLTIGGGTNCRHNWEQAGSGIKTKFHNQDKAQEIIDAK